MKKLIKNGTIVFFDKTEKADIIISNGKIEKIGKNLKCNECETFDVNGKHIFAGFVDMHVHLREPGQEEKETINSGSKAAAKGGFCSIACMPNTNPVNDNIVVLEYVKAKAEKCAGAKVYPICAATKGQKGEQLTDMLSLYKAGAIAFSDDGLPIASANMLKNVLQYTKEFDIPILNHSEDISLSAGGVANEGYNASILGLKGIPNSSEAVGVARDIIIAESLNASVHLCHISTAQSVQLIREAKARGVSVTAETCPHYFALTDECITGFNTNAKINPPLRSEADRKAVIKGIKDGTIDCIATDHAPHSKADKECAFADAAFGASGLETAFGVSYTHLVKTGEISLNKLSMLLTKTPANILKLNALGLIEGACADITIAELDKKYVIDKKTFISQGKNTPFDGKEVYGEIAMTIVNGKVCYKKGEKA